MDFVDLGDVNNHLLGFEKAVKGEKELLPSPAKTMMVFMVRGLFTPLRFPYICPISMHKANWWPVISPILEGCVSLGVNDIQGE